MKQVVAAEEADMPGKELQFWKSENGMSYTLAFVLVLVGLILAVLLYTCG